MKLGKTKGTHLHKLAKVLLNRMPSKFSADYRKNHETVVGLGLLPETKAEQNKLAGEVTNLAKRKARAEKAEAAG
jgi:ribosomal protein S17E